MLAGCNTKTLDMAYTTPPDYRERHPITIKEGARTVEVLVGSRRGGLNPTQRAEVLTPSPTPGGAKRPAASSSKRPSALERCCVARGHARDQINPDCGIGAAPCACAARLSADRSKAIPRHPDEPIRWSRRRRTRATTSGRTTSARPMTSCTTRTSNTGRSAARPSATWPRWLPIPPTSCSPRRLARLYGAPDLCAR